MDRCSVVHLGKGTDPCLGWCILVLIRAASVAENSQANASRVQINSPPTPARMATWSNLPTPSPNPVSMAPKAGAKLLDCTLLKLQLRLAQICERINTPLSLIKSYKIYSQLWNLV